MRLLIVRHGEAAAGEPDHLRALTETGREQARSLATRLRDEGVQPDAILTSPLLRARQTGEVLARELGAPATPDDRLAPGADAAAVSEAADGRGETVIVVAHQPDCGLIAAELAGGPEPAFPPAAAVAVEL